MQRLLPCPGLPEMLASLNRSTKRGWSRSRQNPLGLTSGETHLSALCPRRGAAPAPHRLLQRTQRQRRGDSTDCPESKSSPSQLCCVFRAGVAPLTSEGLFGDVGCSRLTSASRWTRRSSSSNSETMSGVRRLAAFRREYCFRATLRIAATSLGQRDRPKNQLAGELQPASPVPEAQHHQYHLRDTSSGGAEPISRVLGEERQTLKL